MFKKSLKVGQKNGIDYANGLVQFQSVRLNVISYVIDGVMIDTSAQALSKQMKTFLDAADIDQVLLTHNHEDHTGGAAYLQATKGVPIYINPDSVEDVAKRAHYPMYRKLFWGVRKPFEAKPIGTQFESRNAKWDVIDTPGHAVDHLAFYNHQTGQMFTGDLFVTPKTKLILRDESIPTTLASINKVLTYDFGEIACCHAGIIEDGRVALLEKQAFLMEFIDKVQELHKKGYTEKEIHQQLFPKVFPITRLSRGEWDSLHMVTSVLESNVIYT